MDSGLFNIIYFDRRVTEDRFVDRGHSKRTPSSTGPEQNGVEEDSALVPDVKANIDALLAVFRQVHICRSGRSCLSTISQLSPPNLQTIPTILLVAIMNHDEEFIAPSSPVDVTPMSPSDRLDPDNITGMPFLHHIASEIHNQKIPTMVVPVAVLCKDPTTEPQQTSQEPRQGFAAQLSEAWKGPARVLRYLDAGAVDVLMSPISEDRVRALPSHAYRTYKDSTRTPSISGRKQSRRTSWVGVNESKPYSYLREAMVSALMDGICNPGEQKDEIIHASEVVVAPDRREIVADAVGTWGFSAHDFTDDELLYGIMCMLEHALSVPELEKWRLNQEQLTIFLIACRRVYNSFVLYHNFRHACDVTQAAFFFLLRIGALPPYRGGEDRRDIHKSSPIASLVDPFHTLTLIISAIGHDVGHPGVNNLFLVTLNAPLAQLYNDKSVLESFHCAAYSQILRRHWPAAFSDTTMRKLMINTILATDMALHAQYMNQMGNLHEKLIYNGNVLDGWSQKVLTEYRELTCCLLIKCADICNVARKFETAEEWARILTDEFHNQGLMEQELTMPSCLFGGPPVLNDVIKMGNSQTSFMNIFAGPLFEGVTNVLPPMQICVNEINNNKAIWQDRIDREREKRARKLGALERKPIDGSASPRSGSVEDLSHTRPTPTSDPTSFAAYSLTQSKTSATSSNATATQPGASSGSAAVHIVPTSNEPSDTVFTPDSSYSNPNSSISQSQSGPQSTPTASTSLASMVSQSQSQPQQGQLQNLFSGGAVPFKTQPTSAPVKDGSRHLSLAPLHSSGEITNEVPSSRPLAKTRTTDASLASSTSLASGSGGGGVGGIGAAGSDREPNGTRFGLRYWRARLKSIGGSTPIRGPSSSP